MYVSQESLEYLGNTCGLICFLDMLVSSHSSSSARTAGPITVITVTECCRTNALLSIRTFLILLKYLLIDILKGIHEQIFLQMFRVWFTSQLKQLCVVPLE